MVRNLAILLLLLLVPITSSPSCVLAAAECWKAHFLILTGMDGAFCSQRIYPTPIQRSMQFGLKMVEFYSPIMIMTRFLIPCALQSQLIGTVKLRNHIYLLAQGFETCELRK